MAKEVTSLLRTDSNKRGRKSAAVASHDECFGVSLLVESAISGIIYGVWSGGAGGLSFLLLPLLLQCHGYRHLLMCWTELDSNLALQRALQGSAKRWALGCVNSHPAARGSQEAGFTQPRVNLLFYS